MLLRRVGLRCPLVGSASSLHLAAAAVPPRHVSAHSSSSFSTVHGVAPSALLTCSTTATPQSSIGGLFSTRTINNNINNNTVYAQQRRFQSSTNNNNNSDPAVNKLLEEVMMLTSTPIPIGTLFKSLSQESRQVLMKMKLPLETFLLRHRDTFSVYKNGEKSQIMASRVTDVPLSAMRGVEATTEQIFTGKNTDANLHAVYTVLKYIPNEWSPFVSLGIPEEIRVKFMNKKPKSFFEAHPKYFEVKAQALRSHTFEVRRSLELQRATAAQQQGGGGGEAQ